MLPKIKIAVTGLNAIDNPGPGVPVIRGLLEATTFEAEIIGLAYESLEPGIYMHDMVNKTYQIPYPSAGIEVLVSRLAYIHEKENIDVIIPNFDAELYSFIKLESRLNKMGIKMLLPSLEQFEERSKVNLPDFGEKYDMNVPKSDALYSLSDFDKIKDDYEWPVVVKGKYYDAGIARNKEQLNSYFGKISAKWGLPIIIQQFVDGTEFNVTGVGDGKGNTLSAVPMRKQYITDNGKAWGGIAINDDNLFSLTHHFIESTKWKGGFELELMKDKKNKFWLMEINPRIPAWVYLAVGSGQNIPEIIVNLAMGNEVKPIKELKAGKMFIRYSWDMIVDISEYQELSTTGEL